MRSWYQLIPSIDLASNIVYKIKHYPRGKNREEKVARGSTYRLLLAKEDADVVPMTTAARAYRTTLPSIAGCPSVPTINEKYFWNSRVKINIEETQYMCTTLFKDYHVLLYECTNKIVQEDNNNAIIVKTSLFQGFSFEWLSKTNVHVAICTNILRAKNENLETGRMYLHTKCYREFWSQLRTVGIGMLHLYAQYCPKLLPYWSGL